MKGVDQKQGDGNDNGSDGVDAPSSGKPKDVDGGTGSGTGGRSGAGSATTTEADGNFSDDSEELHLSVELEVTDDVDEGKRGEDDLPPLVKKKSDPEAEQKEGKEAEQKDGEGKVAELPPSSSRGRNGSGKGSSKAAPAASASASASFTTNSRSNSVVDDEFGSEEYGMPEASVANLWDAGETSILVAVRVRPLSSSERAAGDTDLMRSLDSKVLTVQDPAADHADRLVRKRARERSVSVWVGEGGVGGGGAMVGVYVFEGVLCLCVGMGAINECRKLTAQLYFSLPPPPPPFIPSSPLTSSSGASTATRTCTPTRRVHSSLASWTASMPPFLRMAPQARARHTPCSGPTTPPGSWSTRCASSLRARGAARATRRLAFLTR